MPPPGVSMRRATRAGRASLKAAVTRPVARTRSHEAERVVEAELAVGNRVPPEIVVRDRPEGPGAFGLTLTGPAELVAAGCTRACIEGTTFRPARSASQSPSKVARACRRKSACRRRRLRSAKGHARQRRRIHAVVEDRERLCNRALAPGSDGRFSNLPSNAIVVEPPASRAEAVTQPRRIIVNANSKLVSPVLYPGWRPSTATSRIRPSAVCPTPVRGWRYAS